MRVEDIFIANPEAEKIRRERIVKIRKKTGKTQLIVGIYNFTIVSIVIIILLVVAASFIITGTREKEEEEEEEEEDFLSFADLAIFIGGILLLIVAVLLTFALVYLFLAISGYYVLKEREKKFSYSMSWIAIPFLSISLLMNFLFMIGISIELSGWTVYLFVPAMFIPMGLKAASIVFIKETLSDLRELKEGEPIHN